jgi:hypothetical protein
MREDTADPKCSEKKKGDKSALSPKGLFLMDFIYRLSMISRAPQSLKPPAPVCIVVLIFFLSKYKCTTNMVRNSHLHFLETVGYI